MGNKEITKRWAVLSKGFQPSKEKNVVASCLVVILNGFIFN